jgi:hypothetical protein
MNGYEPMDLLDNITRRDWLAGLAMQGLVAQNGLGSDYLEDEDIATLAYGQADAMIREGKECTGYR